MIPRIVHWVWLGADPVPAVFEHYFHSWRRHHPDWQTKLWRDDTLPPLACQAEYAAATSFKKRYDMVRLEIVRQFGGVIVDMDVEAIRPLDPLLHDVAAFVGRINDRHIGNQVLGAVPHHPFFERAVEEVRSGAGTSSEAAGKEFLRRLLTRYPEGVTVFPADTFFHQPSFDPPLRPDDFPDVYAVHHELTSYAEPLPDGTTELRFSRYVAEVAEACGSGLDERARTRLSRAEDRVRRAIATQEEAWRARLRQLEAEREQVKARLRDAEQRLAPPQTGRS